MSHDINFLTYTVYKGSTINRELVCFLMNYCHRIYMLKYMTCHCIVNMAYTSFFLLYLRCDTASNIGETTRNIFTLRVGEKGERPKLLSALVQQKMSTNLTRIRFVLYLKIRKYTTVWTVVISQILFYLIMHHQSRPGWTLWKHFVHNYYT